MVLQVAGVDYGPERLIIELEAGGPVDLGELAESLHSLERLFERQQEGSEGPPPNTKLFVAKIASGSIITEIAPLLVLFNEPLSYMAATNTIKTFAENIILLLKKFSGDESAAEATSEDVRDLQAFIKPLTGRKAAELGIVHARFEKREGDKEIIAEYRMKAPEINIADANLRRVSEREDLLESHAVRHELKREVLMRLFQASVVQGKERGRTGDRAIIAAVSDRDLPLYFAKQSNDYKKQITEDTEYPFTKGYIADVDVEYEGDVPKLLRLLHLHKIVDL